MTTTDGALPGGGVDKLRIKIWDKATGTPVYDNQMGASDSADRATVLGGGGLVIHAGSNALQVAGGAAAGETEAQLLTPPALAPLVTEAVARWQAAGVHGASLGALGQVAVRVDELPGADLALASEGNLWLDRDAAGHGWYIDPTPGDDREFRARVTARISDRVDLLSVLDHELGHLLGLDHDDGADVMAESLAVGVRRVPGPIADVEPSHPGSGLHSRGAGGAPWRVGALTAPVGGDPSAVAAPGAATPGSGRVSAAPGVGGRRDRDAAALDAVLAAWISSRRRPAARLADASRRGPSVGEVGELA